MRVRLVFLYQGRDACDFANEEAAASGDVAEQRLLGPGPSPRNELALTGAANHLSCIDRDRQPPRARPQRARMARIGENARKHVHKLRESI